MKTYPDILADDLRKKFAQLGADSPIVAGHIGSAYLTLRLAIETARPLWEDKIR
jgi:hypothetical protein